MFKKFLWIVVFVFVIIQFFRPVKNQSNAQSPADISTLYSVPLNIQNTLNKACYDCHSNNTRYPWYNNFQPMAWWLNKHVDEGKKHLNFSEFTLNSIAHQYKGLDECVKEIKEGDMPLPSYTWIHRNAILTYAEKEAFVDWCNALRDSIKTKYPADSLVLPKRK